MKRIFQKNYQALILSGIIMVALTILLKISETNYSFVNLENVSKPIYLLINIVVFVFCWLVLASLLFKFSVYKVGGVVSLLILTIVSERYLHVGSNPVTVPLIIIFWLSVIHLILPQFFEKYKIAILGVYGLVIFYFLFVYITTTDFSIQNRQGFAKFMLLPIPIFVVLWGYEQWRWFHILKTDKTNAELTLLKSQINPHFFFNTLNNLYGLVVEKSDKAPEVILKLSDMMRYTIYEGKEDLVLLKNEINYLENYIELHKIRYQKKVEITFTYDVDENLRITPLLFIVFLENAFKHGVEKMRAHAFIHLHMKSEQHRLFFTIKNNFEEIASIEHGGIGLENLKKRLLYSYPNRHELIIEKKASVYAVQLIFEIT